MGAADAAVNRGLVSGGMLSVFFWKIDVTILSNPPSVLQEALTPEV
jgi:hypothetical protein